MKKLFAILWTLLLLGMLLSCARTSPQDSYRTLIRKDNQKNVYNEGN